MENLLNLPSQNVSNINVAETVIPEGVQSPQAEGGDVTTPPLVPEKETLNSPRLLAQAQHERYLIQQQRKLKEKEYKLNLRYKAVQDFEQRRENAKANPLEALESLGIDYNHLTNYVLNGEKPTAEMQVAAVKAEVDHLRAQQEQREIQNRQAARQQAEAEYAEVESDFQEQINSFVTEKADDFPLIRIHGDEELVFDTIKEHYAATARTGKPKILSVEEAANLVEGYRENLLEEARKTKKYGNRFAQEQKKEVDPSRPMASRSLNNEMISSSPTLLPPATENDRIRRAMARLV
jgi:hypothetical protein